MSMLQFPHMNPSIKESSPTASPERKSLSRHDNSTETFCKMIYKELTGGESKYKAISLSHSKGTGGSQCDVQRATLLLK